MTDTPAAIIRDLAALEGRGYDSAGAHLPGLARRAGAMVRRWQDMEAAMQAEGLAIRPAGIAGGCAFCGATEGEACRAYSPESDACARYA